MNKTNRGHRLAKELKKQIRVLNTSAHAVANEAKIAQSYMKTILDGRLPSYNMVTRIAEKGLRIDPDILLDAAGYLPPSRGIKYIEKAPEVDDIPLSAEEWKMCIVTVRGLRSLEKKEKSPTKQQGVQERKATG